jgi:hypothetical protein
MKKIILATATFFCIGAASAQKKTNDVHFGLRAGVNFANIIKDGDNDFSTEIKPGFNAAAFLEIPVVTGFSVQPEVQFSQKGYKATGTVLGTPYDYRVTTNFVEVPLLAKFSPTQSFGIVVGPQFSFLTSTNTKFKTNNSVYENTVDQDNDNLRKNILGGVLGIEVASGGAVFALRYSLDFQTNNGDGTSSTPKYKNQVLGLSVGIRL